MSALATVYPYQRDNLPNLPTTLPAPRPTPPRPRLQGDGEHDCPRCLGRGSVQRTYTPEQLRKLPPWDIPSTHWVACDCTKARREREAIERVWRGLGQVEPVTGTSPLGQHRHRSLWVRVSGLPLLLAHLARVVADDPELRRVARVASDADLLDAETADWGASGDQPQEGEAIERATDGRKAADLYLPPGLLVLLLGQSSKKHAYLATLTEDAVRRRSSKGLPTWIVDETERPLAKGHRTYSEELHRLAVSLPRYIVEGDAVRQVRDWPQAPTGTRPPETAPAKAKDLVVPDELDRDLVAAGRPAGLPRHPKGGAAVDCDVCGGVGAKSIFAGSRGDLLEKCHADGCATGGKVAPLGKLGTRSLPEAKSTPTAAVEASHETSGPQVAAAAAWIRQQLDGGSTPWKTIEANGRDAGFSRATLYRARRLVDIAPTGPVGERVVVLTAPPAGPTTLPPFGRDIHNVEIDNLLDSLK